MVYRDGRSERVAKVGHGSLEELPQAWQVPNGDLLALDFNDPLVLEGWSVRLTTSRTLPTSEARSCSVMSRGTTSPDAVWRPSSRAAR